MPRPLDVRGPANATWGGALASGIALTRGPHAGRLLVALRHDCGCGTLRASFVVYSDDRGQTWKGGDELVLLPKYGGGWMLVDGAALAGVEHEHPIVDDADHALVVAASFGE